MKLLLKTHLFLLRYNQAVWQSPVPQPGAVQPSPGLRGLDEHSRDSLTLAALRTLPSSVLEIFKPTPCRWLGQGLLSSLSAGKEELTSITFPQSEDAPRLHTVPQPGYQDTVTAVPLSPCVPHT